MAPRKKKEPEQAKPSEVIPVTSEQKLKKLLKAAADCKKETSGISSEFGQKVANAVENDHLHRKAFSFARQLHMMTDEKLAECLMHLDHYLEAGGLRARAAKVPGFDFQGEEAETEEPAGQNVTPIGEAARRVVERAGAPA